MDPSSSEPAIEEGRLPEVFGRGRLLAWTVAAAFVLVLPLAGPTSAAESGKDLFLSHECDECHTIRSLGIEIDEAAGTDPADVSDLSGIGADRDKIWIAKYLLKQVEKDGEKHKKRFRGSQAALVALATWLATIGSQEEGR